MPFVYVIARWASRHVAFAIVLIILAEVTNAFTGLTLGATGLAGASMSGLGLAAALAMGGAVAVRRLYGRAGYWGRRWCLFGAFAGNFLLFILLGGLLGGSVALRSPAHDGVSPAWSYRRIDMRPDTLERTATLRPAPAERAPHRTKDQNGKKVFFVALFVLGIVLTYFVAALACGIACSGQGLLAVAVFLLGLGFPAGGIYFLGRAVDQPFRRVSEMSDAERRRSNRRFWLSWAIFGGVFLGTLLLAALTNR